MHEIEPFYLWRDDYIAAEDERSPFFNTEYSEFYYDKQLYNYLIHPQWDVFGSNTLYIKVLYTDYDRQYTIIELMGEWNDAINNDIMLLKREIIELMIDAGINKFILIGENVLIPSSIINSIISRFKSITSLLMASFHSPINSIMVYCRS